MGVVDKLGTRGKIKQLERISGCIVDPIFDKETGAVSFSVKYSPVMTECQIEGFRCMLEVFKEQGYDAKPVKNARDIQEYLFVRR